MPPAFCCAIEWTSDTEEAVQPENSPFDLKDGAEGAATAGTGRGAARRGLGKSTSMNLFGEAEVAFLKAEIFE